MLSDKRNVGIKRFIRNDIILIFGVLLVAAIGMLYLFKFRSVGDTVKVTVDGELYGTYSLSENITEDISTGKNEEQHNVLVIKDGKAFVESATCPDGICVGHASVFRDGESIVCLPNRVVITVESSTTQNPDIII